MFRTRIDAELHQVEAPEHPLVSDVRTVLVRYPDSSASLAVTDIRNRTRTAFNDHLNALVSVYGLRVVNVLPSMDERAIAYDAAFGGSWALEEAKGMRSLLLPAARATWAPGPELRERIDRIADTFGVGEAVVA